ncbi:hypothetical protein RchiOBHm_Chr0c11g0499531 [Rosa chinensis]|uniref:Uncharacterized protein n=1 Tax=Rosa chinensis TaxID=74649 RepID=A0A2P6PGW6_ROSCH|nr:hypothetical protein RchiOBHm_Chr7g0236081 [Rosa chinensis]PRQ61038.1 hypothetical protein RchiOBHm_Chr0c11g0499531 [Rosa chinensis]
MVRNGLWVHLDDILSLHSLPSMLVGNVNNYASVKYGGVAFGLACWMDSNYLIHLGFIASSQDCLV